VKDALSEAVASFLEHRRRRGIKEGTLAVDRYDLERFLAFCRKRGVDDPRAVTPALVDAFCVWLETRYRCRGPGGRGRRLSANTLATTVFKVRSLFRFLVREGRLLVDPARDLVGGRLRVKALERALAPDGLEAMLKTRDEESALGLRDRAMLEVLFGCGLRRAELVSLDLYDVDLGRHLVYVRRGKGGKARVVPVEGSAWKALARYIEAGRPELVTAHSAQALFLATGGRRLGASRLAQIVVESARRARLPRRVTAHDLRHGYATALVRGGADVRVVQKLLGHARIDTTEVYTHLDIEDLQEEHRRTHPRERGA
jgi:integrase/recombinase XerD